MNNKVINIVDDLDDTTVAWLLGYPEHGIILCRGKATSNEEQKNLLQLRERGIAVYTGYDDDTIKSVLDKLDESTKKESEEKILADLKERAKGKEWLGFTDTFQWFGDSEIGFRYTVIDIDLLKMLGLRIQGTYAIYIEIAESHLSYNIREHMFNMFVENVCSYRNLVHLDDWRYKIIDNTGGKFDTNTLYGRLYPDNSLFRKGPDLSYVFTFASCLRDA